MKELCDFLREKRQLLFFLLFFEGSLCLIYGLYGLPWGPAGYTCLVTAVVTLGFLMAGFFRWERKRRQLLILKRQAEQSLETADLPKAETPLEKIYQEIIQDELNVKKVSFTDDVSSYTSYTFKPQLRTVGPKYGKYLGQIQKALAELDGNAAMAELKENGFITLKSVSDDVKLAEEDLLITMTQMEGYVTEGDNTVTVVLDTNLTPELIEEGFVREIISKIQTMRKEAGFEVMDKIMISYQADDKVAAIFDKYGDAIKADVLGLDVVAGSVDGYEKEWNINGETVLLGVKKGE